jgi:hypothetical protein
VLNNKKKIRIPSASGKGRWLIIKPLGQVIRRVIIRAEIGSKLKHLISPYCCDVGSKPLFEHSAV